LPKPDWSTVLTVAHVSDQKLVEQFEGWLQVNGRERVFAWIHLLTPHHPYTARPTSEFGKSRPPTESGRYDEEILLVDALVGRIVDVIGREVGRDRSTIVFLSDHGEAFGEHGTDEHGQSLHREVTRVPLIMVDPLIEPGRSFDGHVSLLDVLPTILELAGARVDGELRGRSLVSDLSGPGRGRLVYTEGMLYGSSERSLIADGYKLMVDEQADADLLYELGPDPDERADLAHSQPERARAMRLELEALHGQLQASAAGESGAEVDALSEEEEAEAIRALQALGYVE
jgi:arylsulfatase A-like enzyme